MTTTRHVDEQTLIAIALNPRESTPHIDQCEVCRHDVALWRGIADAAQVSVASAPPPSDDLGERILASVQGAPLHSHTAVRLRRYERSRRPVRRTRWLAVATVLVIVVAVVAITLFVGSAGPSTAAVLRKIRSAPSLIASTTKAVYVNEYSTVRERNGYVVINYRIKGVFNPRTNAFRVTFTPQYSGEHLASFTYSSDGSLVYLPCNPSFRLIGKPPCLAYPAQGGGRSDWLALTYLREAQRPVTRLGERTIGSSQTTGYELTVPISADSVGVLPFGTLSGPSGINSSKTFRVDVWSDTRGLIQQLDLTYPYEETSAAPPKLLTITDHERLSYGESAPRLNAPNRATVLVAPNETTAYQLLKSYGDYVGKCFQSGTPLCGSSSDGG
jgi:hypothetical protein